jgi:hypothetical protein
MMHAPTVSVRHLPTMLPSCSIANRVASVDIQPSYSQHIQFFKQPFTYVQQSARHHYQPGHVSYSG